MEYKYYHTPTKQSFAHLFCLKIEQPMSSKFVYIEKAGFKIPVYEDYIDIVEWLIDNCDFNEKIIVSAVAMNSVFILFDSEEDALKFKLSEFCDNAYSV